MTKNYKPFIKSSVLHPHIVHETGTENPQHMYEASNDIFAAIGKDPLRGIDPTIQQGSTGIVGFIKEHPLLSILAGLSIGAAGYALISGGGGRRSNPDGSESVEVDEDGNEILDGEILSSGTKPIYRQKKQPVTQIQLALPPHQPVHNPYYIQNPSEPIVIKSRDQPPVTITMPSEKGVEVSAPGFGTSTVAAAPLVKKRRKRKKPDRVQVRDGSGKFTSHTVKRTAVDLSAYAAKK